MSQNNKFHQICMLFGMAPLSENPRTQRILSVYSWINVSALILVVMFGFSIDIFGTGYILSSFVTSAVFLSVIIAHIVTIIESLVKREEQEQFFAKLQELDDIFRCKLRHKIRIQPKRRKLIWKYSILSCVVLFHFLFYICTITTHNYKGFFWHAIVSVIVSRMRFIQACVYVEWITFRFESLNLVLEQIASCRLQQANRILDVDYSTIANPGRIFVVKTVYAKLYDVVQLLNDNLGFSILALTVYYCLDIICNSYWLFLALVKYLPSHHNYKCCAIIFPLILLLAFYCYACNECMDQAHFTKQLVQKMLSNTSNDHTNYLLTDFLLQMRHQPISFHAKRFFYIDKKLLTAICAAIIGYLVILIQFLYTENEL